MTTYATANHNLDDVCALLHDFIGESRYAKDLRPAGIALMVQRPDVLTVVAYRGAAPAGIVMAVAYDHPLFVTRPASDLLVYVRPAYRGSTIAVRLVKMLEHWAKAQGTDGVMLGQSTQIGDMRRVMKFYERLGYTPTGFNCVKEF